MSTESCVLGVLFMWCVDAPIMSVSSTNISVDPLVVVNNSTLTLSCAVDAYPPVDADAISWYKDAAYAGLCAHINKLVFGVFSVGNFLFPTYKHVCLSKSRIDRQWHIEACYLFQVYV